MRLMKSGNLRLNTENGATTWVTGMFALIFIMLIASFEFQLAIFKATSDKLEDTLSSSGLAAALIDIETYGINHELIIKDVERSYEIYEETLKTNLNILDRQTAHNSLISGPVIIDCFRIYNVSDDLVTEVVMSEGNVSETNTGVLGQMRAPNNQLIESTGIYSEISFPVRAFGGATYVARKSKLVEVNSIYD